MILNSCGLQVVGSPACTKSAENRRISTRNEFQHNVLLPLFSFPLITFSLQVMSLYVAKKKLLYNLFFSDCCTGLLCYLIHTLRPPGPLLSATMNYILCFYWFRCLCKELIY
ncbi:Major facilitator superfamily domain-containing protein 4A [Frankliniella fusca]|uniref:Major facilitator superfamily domain-containing protein 4A n=1 Tax=Frankliniella fusca TaxID=407009 RepID=A0AAE1H6Z6_9NEOP|nr:Major facilitator superfamily domain-containing protein 4A [Frankliniella fusca]